MPRTLLPAIVLAACSTPAPGGPSIPDAGPEEPGPAPLVREEVPRRLYLVLGGDVMLQEQLEVIATERGGGDLVAGYSWFLHAVQPVLEGLRPRGEVLFVVNLESPVATERKQVRSFPPLFNGPPEALEGLARGGVDAVTLANNHALDQGRAGLLETVASARTAGLGTGGAGRDEAEARAPLLVGSSVHVAVLAYYLRPAGRGEPAKGPAIAVLDERSLSEVSLARGMADAVVVTVHWVGEFARKPRPELERWVEDLVAAGADAVVCHGPHVLGPSEIVELDDGRQAFVSYSVGNLLSNMGWEVYPAKALEPGRDSAQRIEAREEALAVLEFTLPAVTQVLTGVALVPVWLMDNRYAAFRKDAGPRLIYPLALVNCTLPDPVPCFPASRPEECEDLEATLGALVAKPEISGFCVSGS